VDKLTFSDIAKIPDVYRYSALRQDEKGYNNRAKISEYNYNCQYNYNTEIQLQVVHLLLCLYVYFGLLSINISIKKFVR